LITMNFLDYANNRDSSPGSPPAGAVTPAEGVARGVDRADEARLSRIMVVFAEPNRRPVEAQLFSGKVLLGRILYEPRGEGAVVTVDTPFLHVGFTARIAGPVDFVNYALRAARDMGADIVVIYGVREV